MIYIPKTFQNFQAFKSNLSIRKVFNLFTYFIASPTHLAKEYQA